MYFVLKIFKIFLFTLFRSTCFGHSCVHHQELLSRICSLWSRVVLGSLCPPVLLCCNWIGEYYRVLMGKLEGKWQLGRPGRR